MTDDRQTQNAASEGTGASPCSAINIVFDGPPGPEGGRFVEVETDDGKSINAGEWSQRPDGLWALRITQLPNIEINIDLDKKCAECGKAGAMDSGICMKCVIPAMSGKPMKSAEGRELQKRLKVVLKENR